MLYYLMWSILENVALFKKNVFFELLGRILYICLLSPFVYKFFKFSVFLLIFCLNDLLTIERTLKSIILCSVPPFSSANIYFTHLCALISKLYTFICFHVAIYYSFTSTLRTPFGISHKVGPIVMNSISFCFIRKSLYFSSSFLKEFCWIYSLHPHPLPLLPRLPPSVIISSYSLQPAKFLLINPW